MLKLEKGEKRLLLFMFSLDQVEDIDLKVFAEEPFQLEAEFLYALKKKEIKLFNQIINKYSKSNITETGINNNFIEIKLKLVYSYYEIAGLYYSESEKKKENEEEVEYLIKSSENLKEAKNIAKQIKNY